MADMGYLTEMANLFLGRLDDLIRAVDRVAEALEAEE